MNIELFRKTHDLIQEQLDSTANPCVACSFGKDSMVVLVILAVRRMAVLVAVVAQVAQVAQVLHQHQEKQEMGGLLRHQQLQVLL